MFNGFPAEDVQQIVNHLIMQMPQEEFDKHCKQIATTEEEKK